MIQSMTTPSCFATAIGESTSNFPDCSAVPGKFCQLNQSMQT
jgi:hypothetical protein